MNSPRTIVYRMVDRVWLRSWAHRAAAAAGWGAVTAAGAGCALVLVDAVGVPAPSGLRALPGLFALIVGVRFLWRGGVSRVEAARTVDRRLDLKDRVVSAMEFGQIEPGRPIHALQVADAAAQVAEIRPARILPWPWRRDLALWTAAILLYAVGRLSPHGDAAQANAVGPAPQAVVQESLAIERAVRALAESLPEEDDSGAREAVEEMLALAEDMRKPGSDVETAMEQMGRMRAALQRAAEALDLAAARALLAAWATALDASPHTRAVGRPLGEGAYLEAAEEAERLARRAEEDPDSFSEHSEALGREAEALADQAREAGQQGLSKSFQVLIEGMRDRNGRQIRAGLENQATQMRRQQVREDLARRLQDQMNQLAESGQRMRDAYCQACLAGEECTEGQGECPSSSPSLAGDGEGSEEPGTSAGMGEDPDPFGDPSTLNVDLDLTRLEGRRGEGPSTVTVEQAAPQREGAGRDYRDVYSRYRKLSDAALASEPIPAGYRPVIKRYFESIRPRPPDPTESTDE